MQQVNDYALDYLKGGVLRQKTVGVIGTGHIGGRVIEILSGFGCRILCHSADHNPETARLAEYTDLETLYKQSDIITFHVPLLPSTKHMINSESLAKMKDGVVLINTARGELFDTEAIIEGVETEKSGRLPWMFLKARTEFIMWTVRTIFSVTVIWPISGSFRM